MRYPVWEFTDVTAILALNISNGCNMNVIYVNNTHLPQVNNNSGNTVPTNNSFSEALAVKWARAFLPTVT